MPTNLCTGAVVRGGAYEMGCLFLRCLPGLSPLWRGRFQTPIRISESKSHKTRKLATVPSASCLTHPQPDLTLAPVWVDARCPNTGDDPQKRSVQIVYYERERDKN